ncbi:hypothetical protein [Paenibacillus lignilyticus]|uniref:Uncharacterized protein n=1 Tax=Paenibacillus lignilyticus TaxID=1172615 RepID=A0ABS5CGE3_9BACL|nr:hypothetical protein [Paenibacillus lignilyticus]MBP3964891.1 hypothetical protein [Paenibacillus lignilyticus]
MTIAVLHTISDPAKFFAAAGQADSVGLPAGFKLRVQSRTADRSRSITFWEAPSVEALRQLVESVIGAYSSNEYIEMEMHING